MVQSSDRLVEDPNRRWGFASDTSGAL